MKPVNFLDFKNFDEIVKIEELLRFLYADEITYEEARVLAILISKGGYIALNELSEILNIAQPTVSITTTDLAIKKFIRKNQEMQPISLVLLLEVNSLDSLLQQEIDKDLTSLTFLKEISLFKNFYDMKDLLIKAFRRIFYYNGFLPYILTSLYINPMISRNDLFNEISKRFKLTKHTESIFEGILQNNNDIIEIIFTKHRKKDTFYRAKFSLDELSEIKTKLIEKKNTDLRNVLEITKNSLQQEYNSIIPHQIFQYPSDVKLRIEICLKYYKEIKIINNHIYRVKDNYINILDLVIDNENFTEDHSIYEVQTKNFIQYKNTKKNIFQKESEIDLSQVDFEKRDFILFDHHGCLVLPLKETGNPYYNISPTFIATVSKIFDEIWRAN